MCHFSIKGFSYITLLLCATVWLTLSGCGYQLQKPVSIDKSLQPIYINGNLNLRLMLSRELRAQNIAITNEANLANSVLSIALDESDNRHLTVSSDGRNAESMRTLSVLLTWRNKAITIIEPMPLKADARQINNPENYHAERAENELVTDELRSAIISQAITRIRYAIQ